MKRGAAVLAVVLMAAGCGVVAVAQELPSSLQVVGAVKPTNASPAALAGAQVVVIDKQTGDHIGSGAVLDPQGTFLVELLKSSTFNGRVMRLTMIQAGQSYDLHDGGAPAEFPYAGSFPFPTRVTKTVTVVLAATPSVPSPGFDRFDLNGDHVFDEKDIELLRAGLANGAAEAARFDINGDGVFNSLDVVEARRTLARQRAR